MQEAVDAAAARIGSALDDQPREKVSVLVTLAGIYSSLDMPDRSIALLEQALAVAGKSEPVAERRAGGGPDRAGERGDVRREVR